MVLSKADMDTILKRAGGRCECDGRGHDHGARRCLKNHGTARKFVRGSLFSQSSAPPGPTTVIVVCPDCYAQMRSERAEVWE